MDWFGEAAKIRHWFPSVGDPFSLPIAHFHGYREQVVEVEKWKRGEDSTPMQKLVKILKGK